MNWAIIREPDDEMADDEMADDEMADVRISLGASKLLGGAYITFRGDPGEVVSLLEEAHREAKKSVLDGNYEDQRGRPQG